MHDMKLDKVHISEPFQNLILRCGVVRTRKTPDILGQRGAIYYYHYFQYRVPVRVSTIHALCLLNICKLHLLSRTTGARTVQRVKKARPPVVPIVIH